MTDTNPAEANTWREKYLQALDHQDQSQARADAQSELLRKALVRVSLAADGLDPELDQAMGRLRDHLRAKDQGEIGLQAIMTRLEGAILSYEQRRSRQQDAVQTSLHSLNDGLLHAARQQQKKPLARQLKKQAEQIAAAAGDPTELSRLLTEQTAVMVELLQLADVSETANKGFFSRLFDRNGENRNEENRGAEDRTGEERTDGGRNEAEAVDDPVVGAAVTTASVPEHAIREESVSEDAVAEESVIRSAVTDQVVEQDQSAEPDQSANGTVEAIIEGQFETREEVIEQESKQPEAIFQRPVHEPAFSRISDKILRVLNELLDNIEPAECVVSRVESARARIEAGLNWFELVPTLEDIRDLVMQAYLAAGKEFGAYLLKVDQALADIAGLLGLALSEQQRISRIEQKFQQNLSSQLGVMATSVSQADDIDDLKLLLNQHIGEIEQALAERQQAGNADEPLLQLQARVATLEAEAKTTRNALDAERQKALRDPLTELPNREAYSERVYEEFVRWQRYRRPLTLAVCDIDYFKRINDTYGHQTGDRVLKVLSRGVAKRLREVDFMARYGGEEFVLLLPETSGADALLLLDKIRETIAQTPFHFKEQPVQVTLSMGITEFGEGDTIESVFARADKLLYAAKDKGRNCCLLGVAGESAGDIA